MMRMGESKREKYECLHGCTAKGWSHGAAVGMGLGYEILNLRVVWVHNGPCTPPAVHYLLSGVSHMTTEKYFYNDAALYVVFGQGELV